MLKLPLTIMGLAAATSAALSLMVRHITIDRIRPPVFVQRERTIFGAKNGTQLREGDGVFVPSQSNARFVLDINQGVFLVDAPTQFRVDLLRRKGCGAQTRITLFTGRIYSGIRDFTCKDSFYEIIDLAQSRVIRHKGTDFSVAIAGQRMIAGVTRGEITAIAKGSSLTAHSGSGALLLPNQKPRVIPIDYRLALNAVKIQDVGLQNLAVRGRSGILNRVTVNGLNAEAGNPVGEEWEWAIAIPKPENGLIQINVENPNGVTRLHTFRQSHNQRFARIS